MELPARELMSTGFFIFAILAVFLTSLFGSMCNIYLFHKLTFRFSKSNGFQKLCLMKTVTNSMICYSYLLWVFPVTWLSLVYSDLNYFLNRSIGVLSPTFAYFLNSLLQVCFSCNRFYALYFPFGIKQIKHLKLTEWAIITSTFVISAFSVVTIPEGCGYVYDPNYFLWRAEESECALFIANFIPPFIFGTTIVANCFNVITVTRLMMLNMIGMNKKDSRQRRKRWMIAFIQSVLQDCLQLFDIINSYYLWKKSNEAWFQFLFVTLSFLMVTALDGLVMFICNVNLHPEWNEKCLQKRNGLPSIVAVASSTGF